MDSEFWLTVDIYRDVSVGLRNAMEPPNKKLCSSLRGTATAAVHGDVLALEEGDVPAWAFSLSQDWGKDRYRSVICQSADMMISKQSQFNAGLLLWSSPFVVIPSCRNHTSSFRVPLHPSLADMKCKFVQPDHEDVAPPISVSTTFATPESGDGHATRQ